MKSVKIEVPQGYEIDKEKSTFENIVFKEVKNELPKTWEELGQIKGHYIGVRSEMSQSCGIYTTGKYHTSYQNKNIFATKKQAEASLALAQLSQLREVYRKGWVPSINAYRYSIHFSGNRMEVEEFCIYETFLSFQDEETRDLFLENFRDLIEQAKPLLS